jgi:pimeloyl-[acyl-carrier protein] methyl ester esterase
MRQWRLNDGRILSYAEAGNGPPLVLLHGWAMSSAVFNEALQELSDEYRVLAPDLPGHGGSTAADDYGLEALAGDLQGWLAGLDLGDIRLLGWSLGGQIALHLAAGAGQRLSRLLLVATTPRFVADSEWSHGQSDGQVRIMARGLRRRFAATLDDFFAQQFGADELTDERLQQLQQQVSPAVRPTQAEAALAALETLRCSDLRDQLPTLEVPTLVMHGERDAIIPVAAGRYLAGQLSQARLQLLPGLGHAPFLSRPQESFQLWREFCR